MYGDTEAVRGLARTLRRIGDDIRWEAETLAARADAVPWRGVAADVMRATAHHRAGGLRRSADLHDAAARALEDHADEVDRVKRLIAAIESRVMAMVAEARIRIAAVADGVAGALGAVGDAVGGVVGGVVGGAVEGVVDPLDHLLDRFDPPPSGHRDWLTVDLPGLDLPSVDLPDGHLPIGLPDVDMPMLDRAAA